MLSPSSAETGIATEVVDAQPSDVRADVGDDGVEDVLRPVDEVHLVDRQHEVADAERRGDGEMAAGLLEQAGAGVDEDHGEVGGRRAGHHVARVLRVAGVVADDERPASGVAK